ncbi:MAG: arsenical pump-driving ATPase [Propionibacteriaceae bacterium]|jgi:arsenite-transporting ATPase|nr:arsenical pump-driving ATPase [Propionibacteriaceae bacterium]
MRFVESAPRFVMFTGKGGVGKTSLACAMAVRLADQGRRVLLVSTDPASNVGQVFSTEIGNRVVPILEVPGLDALEIDPQAAAAEYRERIIAPVRDFLPAKELSEITEQLSGSCTTEVASFNEFTSLLADPAETSAYDHVVFDTAPTGHTIRLLQLPGDWTKFLNDGKGDASCLGPLSGLEKQRSTYQRAVEALGDTGRTRLVLVARPEPSSLVEVARTTDELGKIGIHVANLVVNAVLPDWAAVDELSGAIQRRERAALAAIPDMVAGLPRDRVTLKTVNAVGVDALRAILEDDTPPAALPGDASTPFAPVWPAVAALVNELAGLDHGLVMCMGKGGVGKTTVATLLATELAARGKDVHLTSTDPAGKIDETLAAAVPNLRVSRIDPVKAVADYRAHVMATKGAELDDDGRAVLAEDLESPCTEEIAVFERFAQVVAESGQRIVIMDTAPTGHTLLLMDATGSYHREATRHLAAGETAVTPLMRLQDPDQTRIIIVTLAETTPVLEAEELAADLARAGIKPWGWVVNQSLAVARTTSPLLAKRAAAEQPHLTEVASQAQRLAVIPLAA